MKSFQINTTAWIPSALVLPTRGTGASYCAGDAGLGGGTERVVRDRHVLGTSVWRPATC